MVKSDYPNTSSPAKPVSQQDIQMELHADDVSTQAIMLWEALRMNVVVLATLPMSVTPR